LAKTGDGAGLRTYIVEYSDELIYLLRKPMGQFCTIRSRIFGNILMDEKGAKKVAKVSVPGKIRVLCSTTTP
jgi:hypothetical protein